jgi:hypothetical protein
MFPDDPLVWKVVGGVVLPPAAELRVDEDFAVGTVAFESFDESVVRKLAFERRRSSLKNGMICSEGRYEHGAVGSWTRQVVVAELST